MHECDGAVRRGQDGRESRGMSRLRRAGVLAIAILASAPLAATAAPAHRSTLARSATAGASYGGLTSQDFPVIVEVNKTRRKVVRTVIAIRLTCTSGGFVTTPDTYGRLPIGKTGKFSMSFGPETQRNDDGTTTDFEGSVSGAFNSDRTKVSGTWSYKATDHDASGAITDTCDSGSVDWSAKQ
jgi:hypothetical protein